MVFSLNKIIFGQPQGIAPTTLKTLFQVFKKKEKGGNHKGLPLRAACRGNPT